MGVYPGGFCANFRKRLFQGLMLTQRAFGFLLLAIGKIEVIDYDNQNLTQSRKDAKKKRF